jgi:predicted aspartyl protease
VEATVQRSELMEAPNIHSSVAARDQRWRDEYEAFSRMLPELLRTHRGKFVAVHKGAVIAVADSFKDAAVQAYQKVGYVPLHVGLVSDVSRPAVRIPSPRVKAPALSDMMRYRYNHQVSPPAPFVHVAMYRIDGGGTPVTVPALIDSGADRTVIPIILAEELALPRSGMIEVAGLNQAATMMAVYVIRIGIGDLTPVVADVIGAASEQYVLLGRDILNGYRVTLDGPGLICTIEEP